MCDGQYSDMNFCAACSSLNVGSEAQWNGKSS
jgi:hypothetical protein